VAKGRLKIVRVDWLDAHGGIRRGWRPREELSKRKPAHAVSIGVMLESTPKHVVLCPHFVSESYGLDTDSMEGDGEISIPRDWVSKITVLGRL